MLGVVSQQNYAQRRLCFYPPQCILGNLIASLCEPNNSLHKAVQFWPWWKEAVLKGVREFMRKNAPLCIFHVFVGSWRSNCSSRWVKECGAVSMGFKCCLSINLGTLKAERQQCGRWRPLSFRIL